MSGPPPAYHPTGQFYSESQPPPPGPQYNQFQGPISSQPAGYPAQPYAPVTYVQQPQPQPQTIIITDNNACHDCHHGHCRRHGEITDEQCCCLALAGACCLACLATNN